MMLIKQNEIIPLIANYVPKDAIIVEAGAFTGHDTIRMAHQWPDGTVHAFEPVPQLFDRLLQSVKPYKNVHCYPVALSDQEGVAIFYVSEKPAKPGIPSQAGSVHKPKERLKVSPMQFPYTIEVPTVSLDGWAAQHNISRVDLLWLDMQGHELSVLKASKTVLPTVKAIFTEVSFIESYEGQPHYEDVKAWLESQGFAEVGRDFKNQTDWFFGNALFVR